MALRKLLADERNVPTHILMSDVTLRQMARDYPCNEKQLSRISGMSERKLNEFGTVFIAEIGAYRTACRGVGIKAIADAKFASSALEAITDAEALVIATDWNEFANVDLAVLKEKMRTPIVFDGRNLLDPETMRQFGFHYYSIGRASVRPQ